MSVTSQVLVRVGAVLAASVAPGTTIERDRADAFGLEEAPCINVLVHGIDRNPLGTGQDVCALDLELRMYVRGSDCTLAVESLHDSVHLPLLHDGQLQALVDSIQLPTQEYDRQPADQTSLIKSARYRVTYSVERDAL